jgi:trimeric autotransporter adhesin
MNIKSLTPLIIVMLFLAPRYNYAQAPNLGGAYNFALFTAVGAFNNSGTTAVSGDIGTDVGQFSGFPPGTLIGQIHVADATSATAAAAVHAAYGNLSTVTCGVVLGTTLGNGQLLTPNVYCAGAASTLNGNLILDGQGNPNALFIFKINGMFSTSTFSSVTLINGASLCNVYWQVNGEFILGDNSVFRGNILANGAIELLQSSSLFGRALSRAGAITLHNNMVTLGLQPTASIISAASATTICAGDSVTLSGNIGGTWNTGQTTPTIKVKTSGDYYVTNTSICGSINSNHIIVIVNPTPTCSVTGNTVICQGQSTQLCVPPGSFSYLWSTGAMTNCINVTTAGTYTVTATESNGCKAICSKTVTVGLQSSCSITGSATICSGQNTQLCVPTGSVSYLWSTGATTNCITVTTAGTYAITTTEIGGCINICSKTVSAMPACQITGISTICQGQTSQFCVPSGAASYLWSNAATTNCITVSIAGTYSVTVTEVNSCTSVCSKTLTVNALPVCTITGSNTICQGQTTQLCTPTGATSYAWSSGQTTNCITATAAGTYTVTITNSNGCTNICSKTLTSSAMPICTVTGNDVICQGQTTQLCTPTGAASYLWSNGATTNCITANAVGAFSVTITNAEGCSSICNKLVKSNLDASCPITGNDVICQGQSVQFCAPLGATSYLWSNGETTNCIMATTPGTYSVTATFANSCNSICTKVLTDMPSCSIIGIAAICQGQSTQFCVPPSSAAYLWSNGATTNCITVNTAGVYSVTTTDGMGMTSMCSKTLVINPLPTCSIVGNATICPGETAQLCAPVGFYTYLWNNGVVSNCTTVSAAGTYSVTVTNASGCSSVCTKTLTISTLGSCLITGSDNICIGQSNQLCVPTGAASYLWSTGGTANCIVISAAGTYSVTTTNTNGCSKICSKTVTDGAIPTSPISGSDFICQGQISKLCTPLNSYTYSWSTGASSGCITINSAGTYSMTATNSSGCSSTSSKTVANSVNYTCTISGADFICEGQSTQLCVPAGDFYQWSTGETTNCITANAAGTYFVTVTNASGCSGTCSKTITTRTTPLCTISGNDVACQGQQTQLCVPSGAFYLWSTGEITSCIRVTNTGLYSVTTTNSSGCSSVCMKSTTILPPCSISGRTIICDGEPTTLCVPLGATSYVWNTGSTSNCITINSAGTYSITVTQANGCSSVCSKTVVANPAPTNSISSNCFIQLCAPLGVAYIWSTGATTNCINVSSIGNYSVTVTNSSGCTNVVTKNVSVNPMPTVQIVGKLGLCQGETTLLCASVGFSTYLWNTGATTNCIDVTIAGNYSVTATNSSGCSAVSNKMVTISPIPDCTITGEAILPIGTTSLLCGALGKDYTYQWSTGETTRCITIDTIGIYTLTTTQYGCAASCTKTTSLKPTSSNRSISTTKEADFSSSEGHLEVKIYPNPFNTKTTIEFQNTLANAHVVVELYASGGNKIATLFDKDIKQGIVNKVELNSENLSAGIYICKFINGSQIINEKLILIK